MIFCLRKKIKKNAATKNIQSHKDMSSNDTERQYKAKYTSSEWPVGGTIRTLVRNNALL